LGTGVPETDVHLLEMTASKRSESDRDAASGRPRRNDERQ
jgi:hypothetical protein